MDHQSGQDNFDSRFMKSPDTSVKHDLLPKTGQGYNNESIGGLILLAGLMLLGFKKKNKE
jgi:LPXTG-motif cell wall-anchored protein